jgi:uncharacterized sporulation protein YeaH/YhbH (DUF444 family)
VLFRSYGEVGTKYWGSSIMKEYQQQIRADNFIAATMATKDDVWPVFKKILEKDSAGGEADD